MSLVILFLIFICIVVFIFLRRKSVRKTYTRSFYGETYAGSAGNWNKEIKLADFEINGNVFTDGKIPIDMNNYIPILVCGNSMENNGINDGDVVFVQKCKANDIKTNDVILVINKSEEKIHYKLRKFINFFDGVNTEEFIQANNLDGEIFKECYNTTKQKTDETKEMRIVSETFVGPNDDKKHYSFHSDDLVEGVVKYSVPKEDVNVIRKY